MMIKWCQNPNGVVDNVPMYGIEVEVENYTGRYTNDAVARWWRVDRDGSLRNNGVEYISVPFAPKNVDAVLGCLWPGFAAYGFGATVRCGIHIHSSVLHQTLDQWRKVMATYMLLEPLLFQYVGAERETSVYCVPLYRTPKVMSRLIGAVREMQSGCSRAVGISLLNRVTAKYSALNLIPIGNQGTIEFRHAPTWVSVQPMRVWFDMIAAISQSYEVKAAPLEVYEDGGICGVAETFFPKSVLGSADYTRRISYQLAEDRITDYDISLNVRLFLNAKKEKPKPAAENDWFVPQVAPVTRVTDAVGRKVPNNDRHGYDFDPPDYDEDEIERAAEEEVVMTTTTIRTPQYMIANWAHFGEEQRADVTPERPADPPIQQRRDAIQMAMDRMMQDYLNATPARRR